MSYIAFIERKYIIQNIKKIFELYYYWLFDGNKIVDRNLVVTSP